MVAWLKNWFRTRRHPRPPDLPPGATRAERGVYGERLARHFLVVKCGMRVVACNWRPGGGEKGEIDLICRDGATLVFVEVRARAEGALQRGVRTVTRKKREVLRRTARIYLRRMRRPARHFRFDIVEVTLPGTDKGGEGELYHAENTLLFGKFDNFD